MHLAVRRRFGFHLQIYFSIDIGRIDGDMSKPGADRVDIYPRL
jgi:hypothetical protein